MEKKLIALTDEKFKEIYTSEKFRNEVAYAHGCRSKEGEFKHLKTCSYPIEYIVSEAQKEEALKELERAKKETRKKYKNVLLFVGMGCTYEARYPGDLCNHRIRTEFKNKDGKTYFIEVGTGRGDEMRIDHSVDRDLERSFEIKRGELYTELDKYKMGDDQYWKTMEEIKIYSKQPFYNFKGLERSQEKIKYTKENLLKLVNSQFNCNFQDIIVDNYNISCDGVICISPK